MSRRRSDPSNSWFESNVDFASRMVYFGSFTDTEDTEAGIDHRSSESVIKALIALDIQAPDGDKPITMLMNSIGGDVYHGLAIYDAIRSCRNEVHVLVYGAAFSMAAIVLQAADKRVLAPHARVMIHYGTDGTYDHPKIVARWLEEGKKLDRMTEDILLMRIHQRHPRFSRERLQRSLDFDTILSAREAVDLGLADEILGEHT